MAPVVTTIDGDCPERFDLRQQPVRQRSVRGDPSYRCRNPVRPHRHCPSQITDLFSREVGYATPKDDVRGVVFRDNTILLVKERADGLWTLPGGWADVNESPSEAVVREVYEESGYRTRAAKLLAVFDRSKHCNIPPLPFHIYKLFILCELLGGDAATSNETDEVAFFPEEDLPELSLFRTTPVQVARLFEHLRCPGLPSDFD